MSKRGQAGGIYMDYQATTPADPRVVEAMQPYWSVVYGNPHSADHAFGWAADAAIEAARAQIAALIGADADEIVFTSGATEANNLAVLGIARACAAGTAAHRGQRDRAQMRLGCGAGSIRGGLRGHDRAGRG